MITVIRVVMTISVSGCIKYPLAGSADNQYSRSGLPSTESRSGCYIDHYGQSVRPWRCDHTSHGYGGLDRTMNINCIMI